MKYINANNIDKNKLLSLLNNNICFVGVFNKFCIHCKMMQPEFNKFKNKNNNNTNYIVIEIDSSLLETFNIDVLSKNVNGFPSLLLINKGKFIKEYNNNRTYNNMHKFLINYINTTKSTKSTKNKTTVNKHYTRQKKQKTERSKQSKKNKLFIL